jgi:hypothetical protein
MSKVYMVALGGNLLGTTRLEKHDAPMGVAFGLLHFEVQGSGYDLFKSHCIDRGIVINFDEPAQRLLNTQSIPDLTVTSPEGVRIEGLGTTVSGSDADGWEVCIFGIDGLFYVKEFPHHREDYDGMFSGE